MSFLQLLLSITSIISISNAYYISLNALEWYNASYWCQSYCGAHLASIHSGNDHVTMLDLIDRNPYIYTRVWTGLNDIQTSDTWQWSDGSLFNFGNIKNPITGYIIRGTYPWRSDEPDYNDTDECVAYEVGSNYPASSNSKEWVDRKKTANYHFACNSCSGKLQKYAAVNLRADNYSYAEEHCSRLFGTSLASIHSDDDMMEARITCKQISRDNGCWLGLNDMVTSRDYKWTDGTEWDYGTILHQFPWYQSEPGTASDQQCIFLDPSNGADPGEYLWDDFWCFDSQPKPLCNAPSEVCDAGQWFIATGSRNDWIFTKSPCELTKTKMDPKSFAVIGDKQYFNSAGTLSVEMMYTINSIGRHGNAGMVFYFNQTNCDNFYYVGIWAGHKLAFLGKTVNGVWTLLAHGSLPTYSMGTYYSLKVDLLSGKFWTVSVNGNALIINREDDSFNNANNKLSGYIGIRNVNATFTVKSLYISGEPQYFDANTWYSACTMSPTLSPTPFTSFPSLTPTISPTLNPSIPPTRNPSKSPSISPTDSTTSPTTASPTVDPTPEPTASPTVDTAAPSKYPSESPTTDPSPSPTRDPTYNPSNAPTEPTNIPTAYPTNHTINFIAERAKPINKGRTQMIWIVGIPIGLLLMCGFIVYLFTNYRKETSNNNIRKASGHIQIPSSSAVPASSDIENIELELADDEKTGIEMIGTTQKDINNVEDKDDDENDGCDTKQNHDDDDDDDLEQVTLVPLNDDNIDEDIQTVPANTKELDDHDDGEESDSNSFQYTTPLKGE